MEFKSFDSIKKFGTMRFAVTQKIHGTNAQIYIYQDDATAEVNIQGGSRGRWLYLHDDNYGFAAWIEKNKAELIEKLGLGRHYGEWAGPGINSGEGLSEKTFVLFNHWIFPPERPLPPNTVVVPVLYQGEVSLEALDRVYQDLKDNGSRLVPGFMRTEGVVIEVAGTRYKKVFLKEETNWTKGSGAPKGVNKKVKVDFSHLLQPIRLEKLLSRDERYTALYPESLPDTVKAYVADLVKEEQITGTEDEIKSITKGASRQIFEFIRTTLENSIR